MPSTPLIGGCLCGAVRYECGEPLTPACLCHCESCRRAAGAHVVAWATVPLSSFRLTRGALREYASSAPVRRQFCERCGTPVTYRNEQLPDTIDITVSSLDVPDRVVPVDHIWMSDAPGWDRPRDGRPQFDASRPEMPAAAAGPHAAELPRPDAQAESEARTRQQQLTKPPGSLGRLEDLACWLAARLRAPVPDMPRSEVFVFAADHGVAARGVSAFPQSVTAQMLANFAAGGAAINVLAALEGCRIEVVDVGVAGNPTLPEGVRIERVRAGTRDLLTEAAMTDDELAAALAVGERCAREAVRRGARLLIAGDMGIANTTAAACLICALTGAAPEKVVGRGTGVDDRGLARKTQVVAEAIARARGTGVGQGSAATVAWQTLAHLGGLEIAAMAGFYIESARQGVPVVIDGYISGAAALAAVALEPAALPWMLASHQSAESGHAIALQALGLSPIIDLGMRLGEGTGAALSLSIIRAALSLHRDMATFAEAGVAGAGP